MTSSTADTVRRVGIKLAALAQDGLTFAINDYDLDRYQQVRQLAAELLSTLSGRSADELAMNLGRDFGYATPKIDVRGVIFDGRERVLLMREKADGSALMSCRRFRSAAVNQWQLERALAHHRDPTLPTEFD